eukprot:2918956-Pleurochrysis_carterae.AAC.1
MAEVAMMDDLLVSEEVELGPDDKPPLSDDDEDDDAEGGEGDGNDADELMDGEGSSNALPPTEVIDDLSVSQLSAHTSSVFSVAVNAAQPQLFATGGGDDLAYMWQLGSADPVCKLSGHTDTVSCLAYSSDGQMLATGGLDGNVRVWAVPSGELIISLDGPTQGINWLCWHNRGAVLLTGSEDATAWMWKLPEGNAMQIFSAHSASVGYGGFTNGGRSVVTASEDGTVRLWNPRTGTVDHCMHVGTPHAPVAVTCLGSHHTQPVFLFGGENGALKLAHAETGKVSSESWIVEGGGWSRGRGSLCFQRLTFSNLRMRRALASPAPTTNPTPDPCHKYHHGPEAQSDSGPNLHPKPKPNPLQRTACDEYVCAERRGGCKGEWLR